MLLYIVAPILTPFLLSAVLAYICLPPVGRIARKLPRWLAAAIVMALLVIGLAALALIILPLAEREFVAFLQHMPEYLDWARARLLPWLSGTLGVELTLDMQHFRQAVADCLRIDSDFVKTLLPRITKGGMAIVGFFTTVLLMPVVLFCFPRDWHEFVRRIEDLIPRRLPSVAVIFALLVFGKLFGFFGVLLAPPGSAAMLVALRHLRVHYVDSELYKS